MCFKHLPPALDAQPEVRAVALPRTDVGGRGSSVVLHPHLLSGLQRPHPSAPGWVVIVTTLVCVCGTLHYCTWYDTVVCATMTLVCGVRCIVDCDTTLRYDAVCGTTPVCVEH